MHKNSKLIRYITEFWSLKKSEFTYSIITESVFLFIYFCQADNSRSEKKVFPILMIKIKKNIFRVKICKINTRIVKRFYEKVHSMKNCMVEKTMTERDGPGKSQNVRHRFAMEDGE